MVGCSRNTRPYRADVRLEGSGTENPTLTWNRITREHYDVRYRLAFFNIAETPMQGPGFTQHEADINNTFFLIIPQDEAPELSLVSVYFRHQNSSIRRGIGAVLVFTDIRRQGAAGNWFEADYGGIFLTGADLALLPPLPS